MFPCGWPNRDAQEKMWVFLKLLNVSYFFAESWSEIKLDCYLSGMVEWLYLYDMMEVLWKKKYISIIKN